MRRIRVILAAPYLGDERIGNVWGQILSNLPPVALARLQPFLHLNQKLIGHWDTQKFEQYERKSLHLQGGSVTTMQKPDDLRWLIARNLKFFMSRENCPYPNPNALGVAAKIAPNTVRNLLDPTKRTTTTEKPDGYPTLDKLGAIAEKLGIQVWELLHPDIERSLRERDMYRTIESDFMSRVKAQADAADRFTAATKVKAR